MIGMVRETTPRTMMVLLLVMVMMARAASSLMKVRRWRPRAMMRMGVAVMTTTII